MVPVPGTKKPSTLCTRFFPSSATTDDHDKHGIIKSLQVVSIVLYHQMVRLNPTSDFIIKIF